MKKKDDYLDFELFTKLTKDEPVRYSKNKTTDAEYIGMILGVIVFFAIAALIFG